MLPSLVLSLLALLLLGGLLVFSLLLQDRLLELRHEVRRVEAYQSDARWTARAISSLSQVSRITESGLALGAEAVRGIHKGIAAIPFNILEAIPVTRDTGRLVRAVHDQTAEAIYGSIKLVNRVIGRNLRRGLGDEQPEAGAVADLVAFRHFIDTRPDAVEFRRRYPDVQLVLPGDDIARAPRTASQRYFARLEDGRISGGELR
jgi:hypothetical protein